jgi:hypothetical protein
MVSKCNFQSEIFLQNFQLIKQTSEHYHLHKHNFIVECPNTSFLDFWTHDISSSTMAMKLKHIFDEFLLTQKIVAYGNL